ncbi:hypothetical protein C8R44DRAFT_744237 [Mycena epipterygia]|nr:hypothetical protein C8R44DRAFT_744237 [Mycena epipterygia]
MCAASAGNQWLNPERSKSTNEANPTPPEVYHARRRVFPGPHIYAYPRRFAVLEDDLNCTVFDAKHSRFRIRREYPEAHHVLPRRVWMISGQCGYAIIKREGDARLPYTPPIIIVDELKSAQKESKKSVLTWIMAGARIERAPSGYRGFGVIRSRCTPCATPRGVCISWGVNEITPGVRRK